MSKPCTIYALSFYSRSKVYFSTEQSSFLQGRIANSEAAIPNFPFHRPVRVLSRTQICNSKLSVRPRKSYDGASTRDCALEILSILRFPRPVSQQSRYAAVKLPLLVMLLVPLTLLSKFAIQFFQSVLPRFCHRIFAALFWFHDKDWSVLRLKL